MRRVLFFLVTLASATAQAMPLPDYAIVVSARTWDTPGWQDVVSALQARHNSVVLLSDDPLTNAAGKLRKFQPRYIAFVVAPAELDGAWARRASEQVRTLDDDPYPDALWGIVTGPDAATALRIATTARPLIVRTGLTTTGVNAGLFDTLLTVSDANPPGHWSFTLGTNTTTGAEDVTGPGTAGRFAAFFTNTPPDALVTSAHATQRNLEMPFGLGSIVASHGQLHALDRAAFAAWRKDSAATLPALSALPASPNPKVLLAAGNCLIGDTDRSSHSLGQTWLGAGGVNQLVGYTVPTWFGRSGWGTLELWQNHAGQCSLSEAFFLNQTRLLLALRDIHPSLPALTVTASNIVGNLESSGTPLPANLESLMGELPAEKRRDILGLLHDRDAVAFLGDPAWDARLDGAKRQHPLEWTWTREDSRQVLTVTALTTHAVRDALPFLLPLRLRGGRVTSPDGVEVELTDDLLVLRRADWTAGQSLRFVVSPP